MIRVFAFLAATTFQTPSGGITIDRDAIRFGLGFAVLASEQCPNIKPGPKFISMMSVLEAGAKMEGKTLNRDKFFSELKAEAQSKLAGKDICAEASRVASPDGVLSIK